MKYSRFKVFKIYVHSKVQCMCYLPEAMSFIITAAILI